MGRSGFGAATIARGTAACHGFRAASTEPETEARCPSGRTTSMRSSSSLIGSIGVRQPSCCDCCRRDTNPPSGAQATPVELPTSAVEPRAIAPPPASDGATSWVAERPIEGPPLSLTASDGSGLKLASLRASAVVEGPLAFTEVQLGVRQPREPCARRDVQDRPPQGASVGPLRDEDRRRLARRRGRAEGEGAASRTRTRLHRRQDPALLEQGAGNEFTARVFPIPPGGRKDIRGRVLARADEGRSRTRCLSRAAGARRARRVGGRPRASPRADAPEHFVPNADFVAESGPASDVSALRSGNSSSRA